MEIRSWLLPFFYFRICWLDGNQGIHRITYVGNVATPSQPVVITSLSMLLRIQGNP